MTAIVTSARMVTILSGDVEASMWLWERDPVRMSAELAALSAVVGAASTANGGVGFMTRGGTDGFVAAFDQPSASVQAAMELQRSAASGALRLRIGMHTGEAYPDGRGGFIGPALHVAARLRDMGHGGQILVSGATYRALAERPPSGVGFAELGVVTLPDVGRPEQVFQVLHPDLRLDFPPVRIEAPRAHLPLQLTSFVGRREELKALGEQLGTARLLTLTGAGGCGKTRLAMELAGSAPDWHPHGIWFCDLSAVGDDGDVAPVVQAALALRDFPGMTATEVVTRHLAEARALLVLDNCEQVIEGAAALVSAVTQRCPAVTVLATSREPLGAPGELAWRVPNLGLMVRGDGRGPEGEIPDAAALFGARARAVRPDFVLDDSTAALVAAICARLDGVPLALELAAARCRVLTLPQILEGLDDRFRLLVGGDRTGVPRRQTMLASLAWSHDLLSAEQRTLFRRLSVFAGGFDLDAAQAVGGSEPLGDGDVIDLLSQLVDRSLVVVDDLGGAGRFSLLETVRHYSLDRLVESDEADLVRDRHLAHYQLLAARAPNATDWRAADRELYAGFDREHDNLLAALEWAVASGQVDRGMRLLSGLELSWMTRGRYAEGRRWAEAFDRAAPAGISPGVHARALLVLGWMAEFQLDYAAAAAATKRALELAQRAGDRSLESRAMGRIGYPLAAADYDAGVRLLREAADLARAEGDGFSLSEALLFLGNFTALHDGHPSALVLLREAAAAAGTTGLRLVALPSEVTVAFGMIWAGDVNAGTRSLQQLLFELRHAVYPYWEACAEVYLAFGRLLEGKTALAVAHARSALETAETIGVGMIALSAHTVAALALTVEGDFDSGEGSARVMLTSAASTGPWLAGWFEAIALAVQATALAARGDLAAAELSAQRAMKAGSTYPLPAALAGLAAARIARSRQDPRTAEKRAQRTLAILSASRISALIPEALDVLAALNADVGKDIDAARLAGAAHSQRHRTGAVSLRWGGDDDYLSGVRRRLGEESFTAVYRSGAALSSDETIAWIGRGRAKRQRPAHGWDSLTPAETEVVQLVVEGLSNPDIAARLFVSRRTVSTHLSHVFTKLAVTSRAGLAAKAVSEGKYVS